MCFLILICVFMGNSFFSLGKFSSIILLKIFTDPLSWKSSLSVIPIILKFCLQWEKKGRWLIRGEVKRERRRKDTVFMSRI